MLHHNAWKLLKSHILRCWRCCLKFGSSGEASCSRPFGYIIKILVSTTLDGLGRKFIKPWANHLASFVVACGKVFIHNEVMDNFNNLWGVGSATSSYTID
jgi:hypothetical protein